MYLVDDDGKEHIYMFAPEGWTLSDFAAIAESKKSLFYIDAIENSQIEIITSSPSCDLDFTVQKQSRLSNSYHSLFSAVRCIYY